ncbi:ferritin [Anaerobranca californiensis DSM 14826]|jgi:ferritin|uniref:Ferritin n=1 Tax=Anaerobranca californiensis DSM 14826 TaxID=1120989 RepID=A0A1M6KZQ1_9FIRM|nr:ferritin [Anaerobranca californiensis]SHJ64344.1 ferritin [Anaerobranca californiensis DSM 14826]
MLSERLLNELNLQLKYEMESANYYLAMAAYCDSLDLPGFANFFLVQGEEERFHAMKFYNFINDLGGKVTIYGFDNPRNDFSSLEDVFQSALKHEQFVTKRIHTILDLANEEKHYPTISFLQWFVDEQVEEEASMSQLLSKVKRLGEDNPGIYMLDEELAKRTFTPPATE